jgi:hypothetical protein
MKFILFVCLLPLLAHASIRVIPSFLTEHELERFYNQTIAEHPDTGILRHFSDITIDADLHRRIRQTLMDECEPHVEEANTIVSTLYGESPLHQDYLCSGEGEDVSTSYSNHEHA